jgi:hypothetical protein
MLARKRQLLRYACLQNSHLQKVNSAFGGFATEKLKVLSS